MIGFCLIFLSSICSFFFFFFFFKQKTAYEILIVTGVQTCALPISVELISDRHHRARGPLQQRGQLESLPHLRLVPAGHDPLLVPHRRSSRRDPVVILGRFRSEERRVGKECGSRGWEAR